MRPPPPGGLLFGTGALFETQEPPADSVETQEPPADSVETQEPPADSDETQESPADSDDSYVHIHSDDDVHVHSDDETANSDRDWWAGPFPESAER